jgi:AcrR family transcriptional regulator
MAGAVRARRKAERPNEILEAAFEEFVLHGYAATRLEDVAARAGVTKGTIYVYFENKERLFEALAREGGKELHARIAPFLDDQSEPTADAIRTDLVFLFRTCSNDRRSQELLRLLISEAVRFPGLVDQHFEGFLVPVLDKLKQRLKRGVETGAFRETSALEYPELLMAPALSIHIWKLLFAERRPLDVEQYIQTAVDLLLKGLLPSTPSSPARSKGALRSEK